ncbi:putative endothelin-converting enzyme 1 [Helianthus debilis subsp. tardiflorus]
MQLISLLAFFLKSVQLLFVSLSYFSLCCSAAFSEGMSKDGYGDIVNIDISSVVIERMRKKYSDSPHLKYMKAFEAGSFDAVIDKGNFFPTIITFISIFGKLIFLLNLNGIIQCNNILLLSYRNLGLSFGEFPPFLSGA